MLKQMENQLKKLCLLGLLTTTAALGLIGSPVRAESANTKLYSGTWNINDNGTVGTLFIEVDAQGNFSGSMYFPDTARTDTIEGNWNDAAKKITFTRFLPNNVTQTYVGYLGTNPSDQPATVAGSFKESDVTTGPRQDFEWFAQFAYGIIY